MKMDQQEEPLSRQQFVEFPRKRKHQESGNGEDDDARSPKRKLAKIRPYKPTIIEQFELHHSDIRYLDDADKIAYFKEPAIEKTSAYWMSIDELTDIYFDITDRRHCPPLDRETFNKVHEEMMYRVLYTDTQNRYPLKGWEMRFMLNERKMIPKFAGKKFFHMPKRNKVQEILKEIEFELDPRRNESPSVLPFDKVS